MNKLLKIGSIIYDSKTRILYEVVEILQNEYKVKPVNESGGGPLYSTIPHTGIEKGLSKVDSTIIKKEG